MSKNIKWELIATEVETLIFAVSIDGVGVWIDYINPEDVQETIENHQDYELFDGGQCDPASVYDEVLLALDMGECRVVADDDGEKKCLFDYPLAVEAFGYGE